MQVKAISLWQPWATLMAVGAKKIETRGYPTKVRGLVAIHAAKRWGLEQAAICFGFPNEIDNYEISKELLRVGAVKKKGSTCSVVMPFGAIVAVGELVDCKYITSAMSPPAFPGDWETRGSIIPPAEPERSFGNYECGRYAWIFENLRAIKPIPCKGKQGWFSVEIPDLKPCDGCGSPSETGCACGAGWEET